ncbi:hypothetical protein [Corallococcus macrosporus]|uniref:Uncharacterized protein n=2 Tax=Myxococcaceae TaxID=31 RepID=A0A250JW84_9BACT|nr:hypothetical protein [Corallococcus macrosporus]AEI67337.1 hypothetical protein LILAB_27250 [Corallococcus macrosporus]ATB48129.1 hypothetical protein MYMAC_003755 [Corallococcus macrosporus DSM 14697]
MLLDMYLYFGLPLRPAPRRASVSQASNPRSASVERAGAGQRAASEPRAQEPKAGALLTVIEGGRAGVP